MHSSEQQNFVKNQVQIAWIMVEIKPYSFESMRNSSESEEDDVHKNKDERRSGNTSCMRVLCDRELKRATKRKNVSDVYAARRSRKS